MSTNFFSHFLSFKTANPRTLRTTLVHVILLKCLYFQLYYIEKNKDKNIKEGWEINEASTYKDAFFPLIKQHKDVRLGLGSSEQKNYKVDTLIKGTEKRQVGKTKK